MIDRHSAVGAVLVAASAWASAAELPLTEGPPVVVTATRFEEVHRELPVGVTVVTSQDIERSTATSLAGVLSQFAGIHVRDNTGAPDPQIDLRGFGVTGSQNTLVLVNGQRLTEIELIAPALSAIPLNAVERIEIMRGSGAVPYGAGATGGTINIITRAPRAGERVGVLFAGAGTYDTRDVRGTAVLAGARAGIAVSGSHLESENYRVNNRVRQRNAEVDLRFGGADLPVSLTLSTDEQDLRNPGARTAGQLVTDRRGATTPDDFSSRSGARANLGARWRRGEAELAVNLAYRDREARASQSFFGAVSQLTTEVETWTFSPRLRLPMKMGGAPATLVAGLDVEEWRYDSLLQGGFFSSHALASQRNHALYLQENVELTQRLRVMAGFRWQRSENAVTDLLPVAVRAERTDTPRAWELALRYRFAPDAAVFARAGRSFRIATVDENRFQPTLLLPQTSRDAELGAELERSRTRIRAALFRMNLENEIAFNPLFPPFGANLNLSPTRRQGLELDMQWTPVPRTRLFANLALIDAEFRSGVYGGVDVSGNEIPLVPRRTLAAGASWRIGARTTLAAFARHVGPQRFDNDQANTFIEMPAYTTIDLKLDHETRGWLISATARNLANEKYFSYGIRNAAGTSFNAYPAPERSVFVSAQYRFP